MFLRQTLRALPFIAAMPLLGLIGFWLFERFAFGNVSAFWFSVEALLFLCVLPFLVPLAAVGIWSYYIERRAHH